MAAKRKPQGRRRGFDTGGIYGGPGISSDSLGRSISSGQSSIMGLAKDYAGAKGNKASSLNQSNQDATEALGSAPMDVAMKAGGKIKRVAGKPIGKDDGLIAAQRGEYVVRKAAVKKLGTKVLNQVNRGKLPASRGR